MKAALLMLLLLVCLPVAGQHDGFSRKAYERRVEENHRDWEKLNEEFALKIRQKMEAMSRPMNLISQTDTMAIHRARQKEDSIGRRWDEFRKSSYRVIFPDSSSLYLQAYYGAKEVRLKLQIKQGEEEIRITDYLLKRLDRLNLNNK